MDLSDLFAAWRSSPRVASPTKPSAAPWGPKKPLANVGPPQLSSPQPPLQSQVDQLQAQVNTLRQAQQKHEEDVRNQIEALSQDMMQWSAEVKRYVEQQT